jgi:isopentenyl diphosphate isomerase/L-lactate dehydrogenase-like FMN-dependent dehydrogenase
MWGLAVGGQAGVEEVIRAIAAETDLTLALVGARTPAELDSSFIAGPD